MMNKRRELAAAAGQWDPAARTTEDKTPHTNVDDDDDGTSGVLQFSTK